MKVTLTLNGKSVELDLTTEQASALGFEVEVEAEKTKTGYEVVPNNEGYYCADSVGEVVHDIESTLPYVDARYDTGNYYANEKLAEANNRADTLMRKLRRFAAMNGGIPSAADWRNRNIDKYYIHYDYHFASIDNFYIESMELERGFGQVYFLDKEACEKAIEEFHDELLWYFTEYEAMLY